MNEDTQTAPHPAADPAHPAHAAFNWGVFLSLLTIALSSTAVGLNGSHPGVAAALAAGTQQLGPLSLAMQQALPQA